MSRIGKLPIELPANVTLEYTNGSAMVTGPKGTLTQEVSELISVKSENNQVTVSPKNDAKEAAPLYGLTRTLIANMVKGVSDGFEKRLEFHGVGYRASVEGKMLIMNLGFSHPIKYTPREGIEVKVEKNTIIVSGIDKQLVGQTAAEIREFKKPEPYKGKGIRYEGEYIRRKAGKAAVKGGS